MTESIVPASIEEQLRNGPEYSVELEELMRNARDASDFLKALAHESRLLLLCLISERERSVGELAESLGARDSTVSQHLALLRRDGLVAARREAQTIWYSISSTPAREVLESLYRTYCTHPPAKPRSKR